MKVHLLIPFRTLFNLDTDRALAHWRRSCATLGAAARRVATDTGFDALAPEPGASSFNKYQVLDQDYLSPFSRPALQLTLRDPAALPGWRELVSAALAATGAREPEAGWRLEALHLKLHDNTIGIASVCLATRGGAQELAAVWPDLDNFCNEVASRLVAGTLQPLVSTCIDAVRGAQRAPGQWRQKAPLLKPPGEFLAFDDVPLAGYPHWEAATESMLWANRTLELDAAEGELLEAARAWCQVQDDSAYCSHGECLEAVQAGNSLFSNSERLAAYWAALELVQYYYVIFDVLAERQRHWYVVLSTLRRQRALTRTFASVHRISSFLDFVRDEFNDALIGLQAERKRFAVHLHRAYDLQDYIDSIFARNHSLTSKVERRMREIGQERQRILQAGIILIGAFQVFDFVLNASWFSKTVPGAADERVPGLVGALGQLSTDAVLNILILFVLLVAVVVAGWRRS